MSVISNGTAISAKAFNAKESALEILNAGQIGGTLASLRAIDSFLLTHDDIGERNLLQLMNSITNHQGKYNFRFGGNVNIAQVKDHLAEIIIKKRIEIGVKK